MWHYFCTVNTDWHAQGAWSEPGWRADLRYEFARQDRLMSGSRRISAADASTEHEERYTLNRNFLFNLYYTAPNGWSYAMQLPWLARDHVHIHDPEGEALVESWRIREVGDMRIGAGHALGDDSGWDMQLGLKLPTGRIHVANAEGDLAERSLQPGTGSTDLIWTTSYHTRPSYHAVSWFAQTAWQHPIAIRDAYRPGDKVSFAIGGRYAWTDAVSLLLQANFQFRGRDHGSNAEEDSGGRVLYLSPGLTYAITPQTQLYIFMQLPVHTYVNGAQLTSTKNLALGFSWRF